MSTAPEGISRTKLHTVTTASISSMAIPSPWQPPGSGSAAGGVLSYVAIAGITVTSLLVGGITTASVMIGCLIYRRKGRRFVTNTKGEYVVALYDILNIS